jgi:light-regulated signal transduction histidine kinase (bacteriophytochrome)
MPFNADTPDGRALLTANDALREASLARQAILAHERQCVERSREAAESFQRMGHELRAFMANAHDADRRLHDRVDQAQNRITKNQLQVLEGFTALRSGLIRGLFAALLALAGGVGGMIWYLLTARIPN